MSIGQAYKQVLTSREQKALVTGCALLIDQTFDDLALLLLKGHAAMKDTSIIFHLPRRYLLRYDILFIKQFLTCIITVSWKLAQPEHHPLSSVAEELAAYAIINQSRVPIEDKLGTEVADQAFERFQEVYFEDRDFEMLFDDSTDGLDQVPEVATALGFESLAFEDWFKPFSDEPSRIAHPYIAQELGSDGRRKK
jgi:hypothetical protein